MEFGPNSPGSLTHNVTGFAPLRGIRAVAYCGCVRPGDGMDETNPANPDNDDATSIVKVREAKAMLDEITARHQVQAPPPRLNWLQRVLNWFRMGS